MAERLKGKVAVVTGAGRGVGAEYALALAAEGAKVLVNDVSRANADAVAARIQEAGGVALANDDDVAVFDSAQHMIGEAVGKLGGIDILIANAGNMRAGWLHETSARDWYDVIDVHLHGTFNVYRHAVPHMIDQRGGTIIVTGAAIGEGAPERVGMGKGSHPQLASYRAAKAAIATMALHAAGELEPYGINVNAIMPGATATPLQQGYYESLAKTDAVGDPLQQGWPVASPAESVPPLGIFLCTEPGRHITGKTFQLNGRQIMVAKAPAVTPAITPESGWWTVEALAEKLPAWLAA
ncbi:MAG: short chain dehydrogenase [Bradyrhizobium sp.]|nr:short chain dehydrogenase [Bradyrhizobium sp.]